MDMEIPPLDSTVVGSGTVPLLESTNIGVLETATSI